MIPVGAALTLNAVCVVLTIQRVLSQLERGCIFVGDTESGESYRVRFQGSELAAEPGDVFEVKGLLRQFRDRFGRDVPQIDSNIMSRVAATGALLGPYLQRLPNLGPVRARRLVERFGAGLLDVLADPSRCDEVSMALEPSKPGLAMKIAMQLYSATAVAAGANELKRAEITFFAALEELGIRESRVATKAWKLLAGLDAVQRLHRHPYVLATLLPWRDADRIGRRLLEREVDGSEVLRRPARLCGAVQSAWMEILADGHTAVSPEGMNAALRARKVDPDVAIPLAAERRLLRLSDDLLRAPGAAWLEDRVSSAIWAMESRRFAISIPAAREDRIQLILRAESKAELDLSEEQRNAVADLLLLPVAGLQGGAGVGKTTVMRVLAEAWESLGGNVVLSALAGKAALTLARGASSSAKPRLASTVARIVGMLERRRAAGEDPTQKTPKGDVLFNERTLLVIDEAGMLDVPSLHRLFSGLPEGARVLFAGDVGQLPPVGLGAFFYKLVEEGSRVVTLTKVLRQAAGSTIPVVAAQIRLGEVPGLIAWQGQTEGVYTVSGDELLGVARRLRAARETLVVAALRKTVSFVNNSEAAARRSAGLEEIRVAPDVYLSVGDPVVMNSNRYAEGLFNGLLGVVTAIGEQLTVRWDGDSETSEVSAEAAADIDLAYAITCHKAQGSAADAVVVAVEQSEMVTREWLYTAVTRGRRLVLLVCDSGAVQLALSRRTVRCTGMKISACRGVRANAG